MFPIGDTLTGVCRQIPDTRQATRRHSNEKAPAQRRGPDTLRASAGKAALRTAADPSTALLRY